MKKSVPMWRAIAAVACGVSYTAISMYLLGKSLLLQQSAAYERDIDALKAKLQEE